MMSGLKLYFDFLSQPSRTLYIFLKKANIPFEPVPVALRKGEHLRDEFKKINKLQKVPFITNQGFQLAESVAIVRYLERENKIEDFWYPKDSQKRAKVDEYLEWQHNNTRLGCGLYFRLNWLVPLMSGKTASPVMLEEAEKNMITCLDNIENIWLDESKYLGGADFSIADIFGACEIEQTRMVGYKPFEGRKKLAAWYESVKKESNPYYDEAHVFLNKVAAKANADKK